MKSHESYYRGGSGSLKLLMDGAFSCMRTSVAIRASSRKLLREEHIAACYSSTPEDTTCVDLGVERNDI